MVNLKLFSVSTHTSPRGRADILYLMVAPALAFHCILGQADENDISKPSQICFQLWKMCC